jgi:hypothetical protein
MIETMLMASSSSAGINGMSPIIVGSLGFTTNVGKSPTKSTYHIQNQQICHQQNQESTNGFLCKGSKDTFTSSNNGIIVRNGSSNINMPQAIGNGKNRNGSATIDNNNDTTSSNGTCIILPSMTINSQSKTPYSDATQVRIRSDK